MEEKTGKIKKERNKCDDVVSQDGTKSWFYSDEVKEHFFNPKNFAYNDPDPAKYNAFGEFGSPACGDKMRIWLKIDPKTDRIKDFKWKTFGCASAIAATSMASVIVTEGDGMTLEEAENLKPRDILDRLGGLPARKVHCSVLCDRALREVIKNYRHNNTRAQEN